MRAPVLLPALVEQAFDYKVPTGTPVGALVEATLAGKKRIGAVWDGSTDATLPDSKVKPVHAVLEGVPPLRENFRRFLDWVAEYALAPKGAVLSLCGLAHAAKTTRSAYRPPHYTLTLPTLTPAQQRAAHELLALPKPVLLDGVTGSGKTEVYFHAMAEVLGLVSEGGLTPPSPAVQATPAASGSRHFGATHGLHQRSEDTGEAVGRSRSVSEPLEGVSGNAEKGGPPPSQILVLIPEIALTHQWLERFERTFGARPAVWHSQQTPAARARVWQAVANGSAQVVVGARSALFLPFANLKLIVVDEEHDPSYKQDDGVLYHARDMAVVRGHFEQAPVVLVSATPSLETMLNVRDGKYRSVHLAERFGAAGMPSVALLDMLSAPPERGNFLSPALREAMVKTLNRGEQVLLFLNRRGYAPLLLCRGCGHRFECPDCSAWLVVHGRKYAEGGLTPAASGPRLDGATHRTLSSYLSCHHCGHREPMPTECPSCKAEADKLVACGPGVERIAEEVREMFGLVSEGGLTPVTSGSRHFGATQGSSVGEREQCVGEAEPRSEGVVSSPFTPECRTLKLAVLSSDEAIAAETWAQIERGEIDILIGTQMVAKGHHFPNLTLVGVVDADVGLQGADLRAGERTFQLLHQLGGRAGRGDQPGTVLIQTYEKNHPIMQALTRHDRDAVMQLEAQLREQGGWPPYGQLVAILLDGTNDAAVRAAGQQLARTAPQDARIRVLGPAPAPLSKLRGQFRYRLLVKIQPGLHPQRTLRAWLKDQKFKGVRVKVDVNPYYFL